MSALIEPAVITCRNAPQTRRTPPCRTTMFPFCMSSPSALGFPGSHDHDHCWALDYRTRKSLFLPHRTFVALPHRRPRDVLARASAPSDGPPSLIDQNQSASDLVEQRMRILPESMVVLPTTYLSQLPNDLKSDLENAAFALANGPVQRECGERAGEKLLQLSQAWEKGDTQAAAIAADELRYVLPGDLGLRTAIGKRLIAAGRQFASMGSYDKGQLQKIANALTGAGEVLYVSDSIKITEEPPVVTRTYKFGDLQVELTPQKCYIGCLVAFGFSALSWGLTNSLQSVPEGTLEFANANATLLARSLRGVLLLLGSGSTILSGITLVGLLGLGIQLSSRQSDD